MKTLMNVCNRIMGAVQKQVVAMFKFFLVLLADAAGFDRSRCV